MGTFLKTSTLRESVNVISNWTKFTIRQLQDWGACFRTNQIKNKVWNFRLHLQLAYVNFFPRWFRVWELIVFSPNHLLFFSKLLLSCFPLFNKYRLPRAFIGFKCNENRIRQIRPTTKLKFKLACVCVRKTMKATRVT